MKPQKATEGFVAPGEKPMFDSADLLIEGTAKLRYDAEVELKKDINELRQMIHQRGLDKGLPREILDALSDIASSINRIHQVWDDEKTIAKESDEDNEIEKQLNRGDEIVAYSKRTTQVLRLRESRVKMSTLLWMLLDRMNRLQDKIRENDSFDFRRK